MTAGQKRVKAKFKQAIAIRKRTGCSLKEAFAAAYGKKKIGALKVSRTGKLKKSRTTKKRNTHKLKTTKVVSTQTIAGIETDLKRKYDLASKMVAIFKSNIVFNKSMSQTQPEKKGYYNVMAKIERKKLKDMIKIKNKLIKFK